MRTTRRVARVAIAPALVLAFSAMLAFASCKKDPEPAAAAPTAKGAAAADDDEDEGKKVAAERARARKKARERARAERDRRRDDPAAAEDDEDAEDESPRGRTRDAATREEAERETATEPPRKKEAGGTAAEREETRARAEPPTLEGAKKGAERETTARGPGRAADPSAAGDRGAPLLGPRRELTERAGDGAAPDRRAAPPRRADRPGSRREERPAPPAHSPPTATPPAAAPPLGPPLELGALLSLDEVTSVTKTRARLEQGALQGIQPHSGYNSVYYRDRKDDRFGVSVQVWKDPRTVSPMWRFGQMTKTFPNVTENSAVTAKTFFAYWGDVYFLVYLVEKQRMTVALTCGNHICADPEHLVALGRRVAERLEKR